MPPNVTSNHSRTSAIGGGEKSTPIDRVELTSVTIVPAA
jgi:hypothetical protein